MSAERDFATAAIQAIAARGGDYGELGVPAGLRHGVIAAELRRAGVWFQMDARRGAVVLGLKRDERLLRAARSEV